MNTQKLLVGIAVVVALLLGGYGAFKSPGTGPAGQNGKNGENGQTLGAVSTLDGVDNPYVTIAGQKEWHGAVGLSATSSTICSIKNPYNSTSTVDRSGLKVTSGMVGANSVSLSTSTNTYATSSTVLVIDASIASGNGASIVWQFGVGSTTNARLLPNTLANGASAVTLGPGEYLNWRLATTTGAGALAAYYGGTCSALIYGN